MLARTGNQGSGVECRVPEISHYAGVQLYIDQACVSCQYIWLSESDKNYTSFRINNYGIVVIDFLCIQACTPFSSSRPGFISRDTETRVCYVTCHHPRNAEVFTIIRQACLRSLSCEVSCGYNIFIVACANIVW